MWEDLDSRAGCWARNNISKPDLYNTYLKAVLKSILDKAIKTNTVGLVVCVELYCLYFARVRLMDAFVMCLHVASWYVDQ